MWQYAEKRRKNMMKTLRNSCRVKEYNMTFNEEKGIFSTENLTLFGSVSTQGTIKPDPERLNPLKELPPPQNAAAQRHAISMFSCYSKWIPMFF